MDNQALIEGVYTTTHRPDGAVCRIRHMDTADIVAVVELERACFTTHWPVATYQNELLNPAAVYLVAEIDGTVVGFAGMWVSADEAHITLLAVRSEYRRKGIGTRLLIGLLEEARYHGATAATLEVRKSNECALGMYHAAGFVETHERPGYYSDTGEAAVIMWVYDIQSSRYTALLGQLRAGLEERCPPTSSV